MSRNANRGKPRTGAQAAKAMAAARRGGKQGGAGGGGSALGRLSGVSWVTVAASLVVVALLAAITVYLVPRYQESNAREAFVPSASNPDPSGDIEGVVSTDYPAGLHVQADQRVAYDESVPYGGPHDQIWATCNGVVYPEPLRDENAVHSLEHGAVWITYDPAALDEQDIASLAAKVDNQPFMFMSPYPELDRPLSLQGWGRQLKLDDPADPRVDQFVSAVRGNQAIFPEPGATCDTNNPTLFDPADPPPADEGEPGPDAVPMDGSGADSVADGSGAEPPPVPAAPSTVPGG